jgi:hypothetical protein
LEEARQYSVVIVARDFARCKFFEANLHVQGAARKEAGIWTYRDVRIRFIFLPCGFLSARWLPARPRAVASVEITTDVTNFGGFETDTPPPLITPSPTCR